MATIRNILILMDKLLKTGSDKKGEFDRTYWLFVYDKNMLEAATYKS